MNYKGHILVGLFLTTLLVVGLTKYLFADFTLAEFAVLFLISLIFSQLPDIDTQASKIRYLVTILFIIMSLYFIWTKNILMAVTVLVSLLAVWLMGLVEGFQHRGYIHTYVAGFLFSLPLVMFGFWFFLCALINFSSHLVVDRFWKGGHDKW